MQKRESFTSVRLSRFIDEKLSGVIGKGISFLFYAEIFGQFVSVFFHPQHMVDLSSFLQILKIVFHHHVKVEISG